MRFGHAKCFGRALTVLCWLAVSQILTGTGVSQETDDLASALDRFAEIQQEVASLQTQSMQGYSPEMTAEESEAFRKRMMKVQTDEIRPRVAVAFGVLIPFAKDRRVLDGLAWAVNHDPGSENAKAAAAALAEHHPTDPAVLQLATRFQFAPMAWTIPLLEQILAAEIPEEHRMQAMVCLAGCCKSLRNFPAMFESLSEDHRQMISEQYGNDFLRAIQESNPEAYEARAITTYEEVARRFGDLKLHGREVQQVVGSAIFELQHLSVGKTAPDIAGEDIDGVAFKLSDYRGKVVMLDFWGDW